MISSGDALKSLALEAALSPQEEKLEIGRKKQKLFIGIPKETEFQEQRVALVPESVGLLVANGHRVLVESNAGKNANFEDNEYSESGAEIIYDTHECHRLFQLHFRCIHYLQNSHSFLHWILPKPDVHWQPINLLILEPKRLFVPETLFLLVFQ